MDIDERQELKLLLFSFVSVLIVWLGIYHINLFEMVPQYDAITGFMPYLSRYLQDGSYRIVDMDFSLFGGIPIHPTVGSLPFLESVSFLVKDLILLINTFTFYILSALTYFFLSSLTDFNKKMADSAWGLIIFGIFINLLPVVVWRIEHGHHNIIMGMGLFFILMRFLVCLELQKKITLVYMIMGFYFIANILSYHAHQIIYYVSLFFVVLLFTGLGKLKNYKKIVSRITLLYFLIFIMGGVIAFDTFTTMLKYAFSNEFSRSVSGGNQIFSYITGGVGDWLSILSFSKLLLPVSRNHFLFHELHYPISISVFVVAIFWSMLTPFIKRLFFASVLFYVLALIFCLNISWYTDLLSLLPVFKSFRVPQRLLVAPSLLIMWISFLAIASRIEFNKLKHLEVLIFLAISIVISFFASKIFLVAVPILEVCSLILFILSRLKNNSKFTLAGVGVWFVAAIISVQTIYLQTNQASSILNLANQTNAIIEQQRPLLKTPFYKSSVRPISPFSNFSLLAGIPGVEGVWTPLSKYVIYDAKLSRSNIDMTKNIFSITSNEYFEAMKSKFNLRNSITFKESQIFINPFSNVDLNQTFLEGTDDLVGCQAGKLTTIKVLSKKSFEVEISGAEGEIQNGCYQLPFFYSNLWKLQNGVNKAEILESQDGTAILKLDENVKTLSITGEHKSGIGIWSKVFLALFFITCLLLAKRIKFI